MTGTNPKGPYSFRSKILDSPSSMFSGTISSNNHHALFEFKGQWYIAYHTQTLEKAMKDAGLLPARLPHPATGVLQADTRCRNPHIDAVTINPDGAIAEISGTRAGVSQVGRLDPYRPTEAATIGVMAGISVKEDTAAGANPASQAVLTGINSGDWLALYGVDFGGAGAKKFSCRVKAPPTGLAAIQIRLDFPSGTVAGYASIKRAEGDASGAYSELTVDLPRPITGVHDLVFVFYGESWEFDRWLFIQ
jgi:arabinoxylan arabinofuranohydrolase